MERNYPEIIISNEGVTWLDKGQMWMYKNNLEQCDPNIKNGELVDIVTRDGRYLGTGFISLESHITVRILSKNQNEIIDRQFFQNRIQQAYDFRKTVEGDNLSNCRLIFGEADLLPGLVIDRYNDILVSQISSYGLEQIKDMIYEIVLDVLKADGEDVKGIYERNDIQIRTKEGLEQYKGYYKNKDLPTQTIINENGLLLHVDVENGQKTGYFLDQKSNRYLLRKIAHGKRVVDCFSHTGGFALNAAMGNASHVVSVDVSKTALDQGYQNAKLNHLEEKVHIVQGDIKEASVIFKPASFDVVTCNPPYMTENHGIENFEEPKAIARHEIKCTLDDVIRETAKVLKPGGRFYMVHRPRRLVEIMNLMSMYKIEPKRLRMVHPFKDKDANMLLIEGHRGRKSMMKVEAPLIVYKEQGVYTDEILEIYGKR